MATLAQLVEDRADLAPGGVDLLSLILQEWSLIADLAMSDLVLWVPTWNDGGLVAVAQVRPTTGPTVVPEDVVGTFVPRGRHPHLDRVVALRRPVRSRSSDRACAPTAVEAYPVKHDGRVIAVVERHPSSAPRVAGRLEEIYLASADDLLTMLADGLFPTVDSGSQSASTPRVGDGLVRLNAQGRVEYASPNAVSALRRLGLATDVVGSSFADLALRLSRKPGPVDESVSAIAAGRANGRADIENAVAVVSIRGIPVTREGNRVGAILFLQDATDLRRRERALISKDATIREIHHRVKNNLQMVAAMLRLQARRASSPDAREALTEAQMRVAAIAVVHEALSTEVGERVEFDEIVERISSLVRDLAPAFNSDAALPIVACEGSWATLPADLATPLAMVVSELLQNAVEHAQASSIDVILERSDHDLRLEVRDDGKGMPVGFDKAASGLGLSIVESLVTGDLHGEFEIDSLDSGTSARVRVPLDGREN